MNTNKTCGFITGSRRYGKPKKSSDIDFVVQVGADTLERIEAIAKEDEIQERKFDNKSDPGPTGITLCFGRLNLILVTDDKAFAIWRKGTLQLVKRKNQGETITREVAIKHFAKLRKNWNKDLPEPKLNGKVHKVEKAKKNAKRR